MEKISVYIVNESLGDGTATFRTFLGKEIAEWYLFHKIESFEDHDPKEIETFVGSKAFIEAVEFTQKVQGEYLQFLKQVDEI